jgi:tRNA U38,U39,U40 pseudouridine synthase TruA
VYNLCVSPSQPPHSRLHRLHVYRDLDVDVLEDCLRRFVGTRDFKAFAGQVEQKIKVKKVRNPM